MRKMGINPWQYHLVASDSWTELCLTCRLQWDPQKQKNPSATIFLGKYSEWNETFLINSSSYETVEFFLLYNTWIFLPTSYFLAFINLEIRNKSWFQRRRRFPYIKEQTAHFYLSKWGHFAISPLCFFLSFPGYWSLKLNYPYFLFWGTEKANFVYITIFNNHRGLNFVACR